MTIDWETRLAAVDAAIATATAPIAWVGWDVRLELQRAGNYYRRFDPLPDSSIFAERSEHVAWRTEMASILGAMDEVGQYADGGPPSFISSSDIPGAMETVIGRLEAAVAEGGYGGDFAEIALRRRRFPPEPRFYVDAYYHFPRQRYVGDTANAGAAYLVLETAMGRSAAFLDLANA